MPELEILRPNGKLDPFAALQVLATMFYPEDEGKRLEFYTVAIVGIALKFSSPERELPNLTGLLPILYAAPTPEQVNVQAANHARNSWAASEILFAMLAAAIHHPELDITPTKIVEVLPGILKGTKTFGGLPVPTSVSTLWEGWRRFKSVAHLHLVWHSAIAAEDTAVPDREGFADLSVQNLLNFLGQAEAFRAEAVKRGFLKFNETWRVPDSIALPKFAPLPAPLPEPLLQALKRYKPKHSGDL
jgi:hypothetical protein